MLQNKLKMTLDYEELSNCMRCGFCQPACPTFRETGFEGASPRGRIALMKATVDGIYEPDQDFIDQMNLCLGCRACEPACPAGVHYGQLIEQAREAIEDHAKETNKYPAWIRFIRTTAFKHVFPHQKRLYKLGKLLRFYQKSGIGKIVRGTGIMKILPKHMAEMEEILPEATNVGLVELLGTHVPAKGKTKVKVGMFHGCIMDVLFHGTNVNTVELLTHAGCEVLIPADQNCCGALHAHSGERAIARELAKKNIKVFKDADVDLIISNGGGCGAMLQEYDHLLKDDPEWKEDSKWFAKRVRDISDVLVELSENLEWKPLNKRITYQDSCHLRNGMKVITPPRQLLQSIPDAKFVELFEADRCCGSAGIYNVVQPEMSGQILEEKMEHVEQTQADILVTANPGCLLQMKLGIHRAGLEGKMEAVHIVDLLAQQLVKKQ
ncbi:(Fe-S)-binding protein [Brevibacillus sp. SYSU BS000544]|uniref:(Fe-S)-binding protein n=1 Tax=Brevibacillus sp. SYSU BS000544 TaxID=3416443 RepID=UPI003CE4AE7A